MNSVIIFSILLPLAIVLGFVVWEQSKRLVTLEGELVRTIEAKSQALAEAHRRVNLRSINFEVTVIDNDSDGNEVSTCIEFYESKGLRFPRITGRQLVQLDEKRRPIKSFRLEGNERILSATFGYDLSESDIPTREVYFDECGRRDVTVVTRVIPRTSSLSVRIRSLSDVVEVIFTTLDENDDVITSKIGIADWPRTMAQRYYDHEDGWPYTIEQLAERFEEIFPNALTESKRSDRVTCSAIPASNNPSVSIEMSCWRGDVIVDLREDLRSAVMNHKRQRALACNSIPHRPSSVKMQVFLRSTWTA